MSRWLIDMESTQVGHHHPVSAGKIKAHNLHLLTGDGQTGPAGMNGVSGYPGPAGQQRQRLQSTGSHSSEDSRQMDESPTGNQSDDSLEAEMKYQEDLKDRLRKSFADLGMNPEGVLKDSLDEDDDDDEDNGFRDSLDGYPSGANLQNNSHAQKPLKREDTFVKPEQRQEDDEDLRDSLDTTQETDEPMDYDKTIDNEMPTYPNAVDNRHLSGGSHHNNNNHGKSNQGSRKNSRDNGYQSPSKGQVAGSTHVRLKDDSGYKKPPSRLSSGRKRDSGSAGSTRNKSGIPRIAGINSKSAGNSPASRPKLPKRTPTITRLGDGEEVRVEYISDDSGDEDLHFVDETGSPIIFAQKREDSELRKQYRIKPTPPKKPSPREQQLLNARRTSAGGSKSRHSSTDSATESNNDRLQQELVIPKSETQPLGVDESTLPSKNNKVTTDSSDKHYNETANPAGPASQAVFGEVRVSSGEAHNDNDDAHDLRLDMRAIKQAAAEQEAALRFPNSSETEERQKGLPQSSDVHRQKIFEQNPDANNVGAYSEQQNAPNIQPQYGRGGRAPENVYHTPNSGYSQRSDVSHVNNRNMQSWQGSANSSIRQPDYHHQQQEQQRRSANQYDTTQQQFQPMRTQDPQSFQPLQQQTMPLAAENPHYQQHQDPRHSYSQQPVQVGFNQQQPVDPRLSQSYQQQPPQWQHQQQQSGYPPAAQGFIQQPLQQPTPNLYGQHGTQHFNQGGPYQQLGAIQMQNMQPAAPLQFHEQYQQQQVPSAPPMDYPDFPMQGNGTYPVQQHPQSALTQQQQQGYHQQQLQQASYQQRPIHSEPTYQQQQQAKQQPAPLRTGPDFISRNKEYLRYGPPKKSYQDMYSVKKPVTGGVTSPPLNPHKPLPSISRENSQNDWVGSDDEAWTRQLVEEQRQIGVLMRGQSDTNITSGLQAAPMYPPPQAGGLPRNSIGHSSWSADHATAYARMQVSQQHQEDASPRTSRTYKVGDDMYNSMGSEDLPMMGGNNRTSPAATRPSDRKDPLRISDPDGYLAKMQKSKQKPIYKEYTLKDYKNLKKDVKLGGLGPDQDTMYERQEKAARQRDYAKTVMQQNKKSLQHAKNRPWRNQTSPGVVHPESPSKRGLAIEYARHVPKPRLPTPPEQVHERLHGALSRQREEEHEEAVAKEMSRLEELKARHMKEKQQVDSLRTEIPGT